MSKAVKNLLRELELNEIPLSEIGVYYKILIPEDIGPEVESLFLEHVHKALDLDSIRKYTKSGMAVIEPQFGYVELTNPQVIPNSLPSLRSKIVIFDCEIAWKGYFSANYEDKTWWGNELTLTIENKLKQIMERGFTYKE